MSQSTSGIGADVAPLGGHRVVNGETLAELMRLYGGMVYGTCLRITGDAHQAADATQETFFQLLRKPTHITGSVAGWLHEVARRRAIDLIRRDAARRRTEAAYAAEPRKVDQWADVSPLVDEALGAMEPEERDILLRHYLAGQTTVALAQMEGVSQATISRRINEGLQTLRHRLRKMGVLAAVPMLSSMMHEARLVLPQAVAQELGKMTMTASAGGVRKAAAVWKVKMAAVGVMTAAAVGVVAFVAMRPAAPGGDISPAAAPALAADSDAAQLTDSASQIADNQMDDPYVSRYGPPAAGLAFGGMARGGMSGMGGMSYVPPRLSRGDNNPETPEGAIAELPRTMGTPIATATPPSGDLSASDGGIPDSAIRLPTEVTRAGPTAVVNFLRAAAPTPPVSADSPVDVANRPVIAPGPATGGRAADTASATQVAARVLQFPKDRSLGWIYLLDENRKPQLDDFFFHGDAIEHRTRVCPAMGDVPIPPGKLVWLDVSPRGTPDLSPLSRLDPNAIYRVDLFDMTITDQAFSHLTKLTGLKQLFLSGSKTSTQASFYLAKLKALEVLVLPDNMTDKDLALVASLPDLKSLHLFGDHKVTDNGLKALAGKQTLELVSLGGGAISDAGLANLKGLDRLEYLYLWGDRITGSGLAHLRQSPVRICNFGKLTHISDDSMAHVAAMPRLESLYLFNAARITSRGMTPLSASRSLRKLNIFGTAVDEKGIALLGNLKTLEHLELPNRSLTDSGVAAVAKMPGLNVLGLYYMPGNHVGNPNPGYGPESLAALDGLQNLERLQLAGRAVTDESIEGIARHEKLKSLTIRGTPLTGAGLSKVKALPSLETLYLDDCEHVAVGDLSQLGDLASLKTLIAYGISDDGRPLDVSRCAELEQLSVSVASTQELHDDDLLPLAKMKHLNHVYLAPAAFTDEGLKTLGSLTELDQLLIGGIDNRGVSRQMTDAGLAHLANLTNLHYLAIHGSFNGSGFKYLKGLRSLGILEIHSLQDVDSKAVQDLKRAMPWVTIWDISKEVPQPARAANKPTSNPASNPASRPRSFGGAIRL